MPTGIAKQLKHIVEYKKRRESNEENAIGIGTILNKQHNQSRKPKKR